MNMKIRKFALSLLALLPFALFVLWLGWQWGSFPDYGVESGYYGQFNRVRHVLEDMPNVTIVDHWQHQDISLEDFGFALMVEGTQNVNVTFSENSPQMRMRSKQKIRSSSRKRWTRSAFTLSQAPPAQSDA